MAFHWHDIPELPLRLAIGPAPGSHPDTSLAKDLQALSDGRFGRVICLLQTFELAHLLEEPTLAEYTRAIHALGMQLEHVPIEDYCAPSPAQLDTIAALVGEGVATYVHCMAGLGRAGTIAAALLIRGGMRPDDAMLLVRWVRPGAIQSDEQEAFLYEIAGRSQGGGKSHSRRADG